MSELSGSDFGRDLMLRLAALRRHGMTIGAREQFEVTALAAELLSRGTIRTVEDFEPYLAPAICRAAEDFAHVDTGRRRFGLTGGQALGPHSPNKTTPPVGRRLPARDPRRLALVSIVILVVAISVGSLLWPGDDPVNPIIDDDEVHDQSSDSNDQKDAKELDGQPTVPLRVQTIQRVTKAAEKFHGMPTLAELAESLESPSGLAPEQRVATLAELSGAPRGQVLDLYGVTQLPPWAPRIAQAIDRMEMPGREGKLAEYEFDQTNAKDIQKHYDLIHQKFTDEQDADGFRGAMNKPALNLSEDPIRKRTFALATGRPFLPSEEPRSIVLSSLVRNILVASPLLLVMFWLAERYRTLRAQVSQRVPKSSPLHTSYIAEAVLKFGRWGEVQHNLAMALQQRDDHELPIIDARETISATLNQGGHILALKNRVLRPSPEYLVLIESKSPGDQQAQHMRALLEPFRERAIAHFDVFFFQTEPSWLLPERGGQSVHIDALRAQFPNHRLIVMGSARGWLRPGDLRPVPSVAKLASWDRRALLTPIPVADWGQTEPAVAAALSMGIGRATPEGVLWLSALLDLNAQAHDGWSAIPLREATRPLDSDLRLRPRSLMNSTPPSDFSEDDVISALRAFLDADGFKWLSALAVYPGMHWELTLYLGLEDRYRGRPLYTSDSNGDERLVSLLQLPWLQAGRMPNWLRLRLLRDMSDDEAGAIYAAVADLFRSARKDNAGTAAGMLLKIGRDLPVGAFDAVPQNDEIMFDFMRRGDTGAFVLPNDFRPEDLPGRFSAMANRVSATGFVLAVISACSLFYFLPAADHPMMTGAWLPLSVFFLGFVTIAASFRMLSLPPWKGRQIAV